MKYFNILKFTFYSLQFLLVISCVDEIEIPEAPETMAQQEFILELSPTISNLYPNGDNILWYESEAVKSPLASTIFLNDSTEYFCSIVVNGQESKNRSKTKVNIFPAKPSEPYVMSFCEGDNPVIADLWEFGNNIKWYDSETSTIPLNETDLLVHGQHYYCTQTLNGNESQVRREIIVSLFGHNYLKNGESIYLELFDLTHNYTLFKEIIDTLKSGESVLWYNSENSTEVINPDTRVTAGEYYFSIKVNDCETIGRNRVIITTNSGLLLFYDMENNMKDISKNNFDGAYNGVFTESVTGAGFGAQFNGINNALYFPESAELEPQLPVTISLWVQFDNLTSDDGVLFTTDYKEDLHSGIGSVLRPDQALGVGIGNGTTPSIYARRSFYIYPNFEAKSWYHIVYTLNNFNDIKIYINGVSIEGYYEGYGTSLVYTDGSGAVGIKDGNIYIEPLYFKGLMDEFGYWNRILSEQEIQNLYKVR